MKRRPKGPKLEIAEKLRARRGKKKTWQRRPTMALCPMPGCETMVDQPMCPEHWPLVSPDVRQELVAAVRALKFAGGRRPKGELGAKVLELYRIAITEVQTALYKRGAEHGSKHVDGNVAAVRPLVGLHQELPPAGQQGGAQAAPEGQHGRAGLIALPTREQVEELGQGHGPGAGPGLPPDEG
jgi:hypothetical protein